jgi:hypothetical protein
MSLSRFVTSVWIWLMALVWLCSVDSWFCQACSGAWAAVTAEFTADVTSMPGELAPSAASRMELRSILDDDDPESNESNAEMELMVFLFLLMLQNLVGLRAWFSSPAFYRHIGGANSAFRRQKKKRGAG